MALLDINSLLSNTDITNIASNPSPFGLGLLGNELIAIKMAATNFSGRLIVWSILL